ncbi:MAG: hypothetical protein AB7Q91_12595 [Phycisphaerales bacterium]
MTIAEQSSPPTGPASSAPRATQDQQPGPRGHGSVRDDRGAFFPLLDQADLKRAAEDIGNRRATLARHLRDCVRAESRRFTPERFGVGLVVSIALLCLVSFTIWVFPQTRPFSLLLLIAASVASMIIIRAYIRRRVAAQLATTAVAEGICGSCAYSLESAAHEPDGCVRCSECGAAWRRERIVRPHWSRAAIHLYEPPWWMRFLLFIPRSRDQLAPDDRGRFVRIVDSRLRLVSPSRKQELGAPRVLESRIAARRAGQSWRLLLTLPLWIIGALIAYTMIGMAMSPRPDTAALIGLGIFTFLVIVSAILIVKSHLFAGPRWVIPAFRRLALCPCCARDLRAGEPDPDGCTTCPECGSAWRLDPPAAAAPGASPPAGASAAAGVPPAPEPSTPSP